MFILCCCSNGVWGFCVVIVSFTCIAINLPRERAGYFNCGVAVSHFLIVPWVGLQSVIVAFPCHVHLLFKQLVSGDQCSPQKHNNFISIVFLYLV